MEAKIMKISSENFCLCWMLFWTGVVHHHYSVAAARCALVLGVNLMGFQIRIFNIKIVDNKFVFQVNLQILSFCSF